MSQKITPAHKARTLRTLIEFPAPFDPITLMRRMNSDLKETYDWHEFGFFLDELNTLKVVEVTGHNRDGMTQYRMRPATAGMIETVLTLTARWCEQAASENYIRGAADMIGTPTK